MDKNKWREKLISGEALCYIKPNLKKHDSGFRCFEVGYLTVNKNNKVKDKLVLNEGVDALQTCGYPHNNGLFMVRMDLLADGYIRLWNNQKKIWWGNLDFVPSSAELEILKN